MRRVLTITFAAALLAVLCASVTSRMPHGTASAQSAQGQSHQPVETGEPDIIDHGMNPHGAKTGFLTAGGTGSLSPISYHNGQLIQTPTAYVIWYGNWNRGNGTDTPAGQQIVRDFLSSVGGSPYYKINTTYSAGGYNVSGNVTRGTAEASPGYSLGTRLTDANIQTIVKNAISAGSLPADANGVYFVLTSSDVSEQSGFCTRYCGWHTSTSYTQTSNGRLRYSFVGNAARCISSCAAQSVGPNGNAGVDGMISVVAHELEEANTDPDPASGWVDSGGAENADKCAWTFGSRQFTASNGAVYNMTLGSRNYLIQRNLAATDNKCYIDWVNKIQ
ncbi:MAG: hypothetical protein QOH49_2816 [Acidobacteriota bacterium]|jgi:hypothetical protein|nr:hypothetical protein [Acidobacteriota bacterium]